MYMGTLAAISRRVAGGEPGVNSSWLREETKRVSTLMWNKETFEVPMGVWPDLRQSVSR